MIDLCSQVKHFLRYYGVTYRSSSSMQYMWLYVQYHDSSTHVGVSPCFFNAYVLLQKQLRSRCIHSRLLLAEPPWIPAYMKLKSDALQLNIVLIISSLPLEIKVAILVQMSSKDWMLLNGPKTLVYIPLTLWWNSTSLTNVLTSKVLQQVSSF